MLKSKHLKQPLFSECAAIFEDIITMEGEPIRYLPRRNAMLVNEVYVII